MGNKLTDGNPAIADLSDKNRPSKLGEKFSELYDNAWTDAYEEIRKTSDEKDTIKKLLQILMYVNEKCKDFWTEYVTSLQKSIKAGSILELPDYIMKQIKDFSRNVAPLLVDQIHKQLLDKWYDYSTSKIIRSRTCEDYVKGCVECCWIMAAQDPPVEIDIKSRMNENFDNNLFRAYTQTGDRLEYVVWPPLYLHENGAILCKGVAQAVRNERSRSAPAASKDRTPGFDESKSFTGSISNQSSKQRNKNTDLFSQSLVASTSSPVNVDITEAGRKLSTNTIGQDSHSPLNKTSYQQTSYQQTNTQYPVAMDTTHQTPQINLPQTNNQQPTLQQSHINPMTGIHKSSLSPPTATGHVLWKHGRFPTNQEMERFLGYLKRGYSEFYTRIKMGDYVFNLCKDYNIYWTQLHQV